MFKSHHKSMLLNNDINAKIIKNIYNIMYKNIFLAKALIKKPVLTKMLDSLNKYLVIGKYMF